MLLLYMKFVVTIFSDNCVLCLLLLQNSPSFLDGFYRFIMYKITSSENGDDFISTQLFYFF